MIVNHLSISQILASMPQFYGSVRQVQRFLDELSARGWIIIRSDEYVSLLEAREKGK